MPGRLLTLEGIDGAGKSTHIDALRTRLARHGAEVVCTREPGGTPLAEALRVLVLEQAMDGLTESLLVYAARRDHVRQVVRPALQRGAVVLCDRFADASHAYQGGGRRLEATVLTQLDEWVLDGLRPDLTLWLDLPPVQAAARLSGGRRADRFEQQDLAFFTRVRDAYRALAEREPQRVVRVDATVGAAAVWRQIDAGLTAHGWT